MKLILFGYYGYRNVGDEQLLDESVRLLKNIANNLDFIVATGNYSLPFPTFSRWNLFDWFRHLIRADALIFGGGSVFQSRSSFGSLLIYLMVVCLARLFRCRVLLLSHGWGPFKFRWHQRLAVWVLCAPHVVRSWRDEMSRDSFGQSNDPVFCDLALLQQRQLDPKVLTTDSYVIGISPTISSYKQLIKVTEKFKTVTIINQLNQLVSKTDILLEDIWDQPSNIGLLITDRYHSAIWASKFGVPWVAYSDDPKLVALAKATNQLIFAPYEELNASVISLIEAVPTFIPDQQLLDWYDSFASYRAEIGEWLHDQLSH